MFWKRRDIERLVSEMGVVADALAGINDQLEKARVEIVGKIDELLTRDVLDDEDRAALEVIRSTAQSLDDVVPDSVTVPLPDPEDPGALDPADPEVIDPENPLPAE